MVPIVLVILVVLLKPIVSLPRQCEPIRMDLCKRLGYNMTSMPNLGGNEYQEEAEFYLKTFQPLINFGCSPQLNLFLCSVYVPMCTEKVSYAIGPCRGLCEGVRDLCYPVLEKFGYPWPETLNCSKFPAENNHEHMCMEGPRDAGAGGAAPRRDGAGGGVGDDVAARTHDCPPYHARRDSSGPCAPLYDPNFLFDAGERNFAEVWITVWATISFVSSLASALTLSIGGGRVKARPLVSLALCYCLVSAGWLARIVTGRNSASWTADNVQEYREDGLANANCAIVFLMVYYFGMAANAWWVALCAWWVAKAGLCWPSEKLRNLGSCLHIAAWGFPAIQTVGALVKRDIDTDELTGTCYVGNKNSAMLLGLVLLPQSLYLAGGVLLLVVGTVFDVRKPQTVSASAPLTGAAPRKESDILGGLATLYIVPTACVLASVCYEYNNRDDWFRGAEKPALWAFLLKHLMSLFVGVSTVFWLWSKRTLTAWRNVLKRLGPRKQIAVKCQMPLVAHPPQHSHIGTAMSTSSRHSSRGHPHRKPRAPQHHHRTIKTII